MKSSATETARGCREVLPDETIANPSNVRRAVLCSGQLYYDLLASREQRKIDDVAILRVEQIYPFPEVELKQALSAYPSGVDTVWVQEEPRNMGAWYFINARQADMVGTRHPLSVVSRPESASPATGSKAAHDLEQKMLLDEAFRG